jgi:polysaccharide export outer membrane protein
MFDVRFRRLSLVCGVCGLAMAVSGCSTLPSSGPTSREVLKETRAPTNNIGMKVVDVTPALADHEAEFDRKVGAEAATLANLATQDAPNDVVGPGDVLGISVYEVGVGLFGGQRTPTEAFDPSAKSENFPSIVIDRNGRIKLPYIAELDVGGRTTGEIQSMIEHAYRGQSQNPQAIVSLRSNLSQTIYVTGDVRRPGRMDLTLQRERLLDAVTAMGGAISPTQDMVVRFTRGSRTVDERLDRVSVDNADNLILEAGDRLELIRQPRTFSILGATNRVTQLAFDQSDLSLAEAIARVGGPNDAAADPRAVFIFRYEVRDGTAGAPTPTIYRLNLMQPVSYFAAQRFGMRDKDVMYISNASINRTAKLIAIINQLFSPFVAARTVSGH